MRKRSVETVNGANSIGYGGRSPTFTSGWARGDQARSATGCQLVGTAENLTSSPTLSCYRPNIHHSPNTATLPHLAVKYSLRQLCDNSWWTANKKLAKLHWPSRKRSPKRLIVLVEPKSGGSIWSHLHARTFLKSPSLAEFKSRLTIHLFNNYTL